MDLKYLQYQLSYYGMKKSKLQYRKKQEFDKFGFYENGTLADNRILYVIDAEELKQYAGNLKGCVVLVTGGCRWMEEYACSALILEDAHTRTGYVIF